MKFHTSGPKVEDQNSSKSGHYIYNGYILSKQVTSRNRNEVYMLGMEK